MDLDEILEANAVIQDLQDAEEQVDYQRQVLQMTDPFTLTDENFMKKFRTSKELTREIIELVTPFMQPATRMSAMTVQRKVLVALRFLATGSYQEITGSNSYTAVSQPTVSRALHEFCDALLQPQIFDNWVHFPNNMGELQQLRNRFYAKYGVPGTIGIIDCTHVAIIRPADNNPLHPEHIYINRKSYHSINVQLICDENLKILNVNARFPGSCHDAHICRESQISQLMEELYRRNDQNIFFLLGDSGYPLRPWLMTPLRNPEPGTPAEAFNNAVLSARSTIERCNGILKNRFRCLLKHRVLHYTPTTAAKIIHSCIVLHNMCIHHRLPEPEAPEIDEDFGMDIPVEDFQDPIGRINPDLTAGRLLQRRIIATHFN